MLTADCQSHCHRSATKSEQYPSAKPQPAPGRASGKARAAICRQLQPVCTPQAARLLQQRLRCRRIHTKSLHQAAHIEEPARNIKRNSLHNSCLRLWRNRRIRSDRAQAIPPKPIYSRRRPMSGQYLVNHAADRIQIRPRPTVFFLYIQFRRRIGDLPGTFRRLLADLKCRAKVDQLPCTVTGTHQIVRADVAMDDPARMQPTKSFEHRCKHCLTLCK